MKTNNETIYGIQSSVERYTLITWTVTVLITSLLGDGIIVLATVKHNAIKLHKVIVVVIQHLAVCNLLLTTVAVFPTTVALIADTWVLGEALAHLHVLVLNTCYPAQRVLTCVMTTLKVLLLKYPLRTASWSRGTGHRICGLMWVLVICVYLPLQVGFMLFIWDTLQFDYASYVCSYDYSSKQAPRWLRYYNLMYINLVIVVPCIILLITSLFILIKAKLAAARYRGTLRWEGVITVLITVGVLFAAFLPFCVVFVARDMGHLNTSIYRGATFLNYLNIMANFFVYCFTVNSFRCYLKKRVVGVVRRVSLQKRRVPPHYVQVYPTPPELGGSTAPSTMEEHLALSPEVEAKTFQNTFV